MKNMKVTRSFFILLINSLREPQDNIKISLLVSVFLPPHPHVEGDDRL